MAWELERVSNQEHYEKVVREGKKTTFASCGFADRFDPFILGKNPRVRKLYGELFRDSLSGIKCDSALDIGCGTGIYFDLLAPLTGSVEALDLSEDMIRIAQDYCERSGLKTIHPKVGTADRLDYPDGSFDVVLALDLLHHVPNLDGLLAEVHRVLRKGGHFFVFEPNICNPLMFFAHAIPREERLALRLNRPALLKKRLETRFSTVKWKGVSALITQCGGFRGFIFDTYLKIWELLGIERLYTRQAWLGRKADVP